jgi:hypothetical protein
MPMLLPPYRFDRDDLVVLARQPDEYTWARHGRELTIGKTYRILWRAGFSNMTSYVLKNDGGYIVSIQDEFFDPAPAGPKQ